MRADGQLEVGGRENWRRSGDELLNLSYDFVILKKDELLLGEREFERVCQFHTKH